MHYTGTVTTTLEVGTFDARMSVWNVKLRMDTNAASLGTLTSQNYYRFDNFWLAATGHQNVTTATAGDASMTLYVDHDDGDKLKVDLSPTGTNSASAYLAVRVLLWDTLSTADGDYADVP